MIKKPVLLIIADYDRNAPELQKVKNLPSVKCYLNVGYSVLHIIATDQVSVTSEYQLSEHHNVVVRPNLGYDFGSWAQSLKYQAYLSKFDYLIFINSSLVGPLHDPSNFFDELLKLKSDIKAAVESAQIVLHFQSYLWAIEPLRLFSSDVKEFLTSFLEISIDRERAISEGEFIFPELLKHLGMNYSVLFPAGSLCPLDKNPSLNEPFRLVSSGFPFIKKSLLESNIANVTFRAELKKLAPNFEWSPDKFSLHLSSPTDETLD
jgi:lipopolysaccharide biosynthesis protein